MTTLLRLSYFVAVVSCSAQLHAQNVIGTTFFDLARFTRSKMLRDTFTPEQYLAHAGTERLEVRNGTLDTIILRDQTNISFHNRRNGLAYGTLKSRSSRLLSELDESQVISTALGFLQSIGTTRLDTTPLPIKDSGGETSEVYFRLTYLGLGTTYSRTVTVDRITGDVVHFAFDTPFEPCTTVAFTPVSSEQAKASALLHFESAFGPGHTFHHIGNPRWHVFTYLNFFKTTSPDHYSFVPIASLADFEAFKHFPVVVVNMRRADNDRWRGMIYLDARDGSPILATTAVTRQALSSGTNVF